MPNILSDSKGPQLSPPILLNLLPFIPYPDFQAATGQLELTSDSHKPPHDIFSVIIYCRNI